MFYFTSFLLFYKLKKNLKLGVSKKTEKPIKPRKQKKN